MFHRAKAVNSENSCSCCQEAHRTSPSVQRSGRRDSLVSFTCRKVPFWHLICPSWYSQLEMQHFLVSLAYMCCLFCRQQVFNSIADSDSISGLIKCICFGTVAPKLQNWHSKSFQGEEEEMYDKLCNDGCSHLLPQKPHTQLQKKACPLHKRLYGLQHIYIPLLSAIPEVAQRYRD